MTETLAGPALLERARLALAVPLARGLRVALVDDSDPAAGAVMPVSDLADNGSGTAHAAAIAALGELAAYLALVPALSPAEHAVTHSVTTHLLDTARAGEHLLAVGRLGRRTGRLAFLDVDCRVGDRPVARLTLVKSVIAWEHPRGEPAE